MITPSFSPTATERVLPKLALDFTTGVLDSRITFTRTTNATNPATYINSSGVITAATNNQPRFDYDPVTLANKGLLIEESRTNLLTYSEQFNNAAWGKGTRVTVNSDVVVSPSGTLTADKLIAAAVTGQHWTNQGTSTPSNTAVSFSFYAKAAEYSWVAFYAADGNVGRAFDLSNGTLLGTIGGVAPTSSSITSVGNGWYRCSVSWTQTTGAPNPRIYVMNSSTNTEFLGDGSSGIYIWGAQLEVGAFATSYIPTTTTALTRNADVATMTGTNFSDWWTATIGSANVSVIPKSTSGTKPLFQMDDGTADNIISLRGNAANPELYIKATTDQAQIDAGTIVANTAYKLAGAWNTNNCAAAQNGAAVVTDTSATIPIVTQARIGSDGTNYANAWLQKVNYWPQRITDNETQAFSK